MMYEKATAREKEFRMSDFSKDFLNTQKKKLLLEKEKIQQNFATFTQETKEAGAQTYSEEGDLAQKYMDQKLNISLRENDLRKLRLIDLALKKIEDGSYGYCEESGDPIEQRRLEKRPWARLTLYFAELEEKERQRTFTRAG